MNGEIHEVTWRGQTIRFELRRKNVRNINLNIRPDMSVMVSANERVPLEVILDFVKGKGSWIIRNTEFFKDAQSETPWDKEYVSGETFKYLGKQVRLKVMDGVPEEVKYFRGYLQLTIKDRDDTRRKARLVDRWFRQKAEATFERVLTQTYPLLEKYGVQRPQIMIRSMKARWGSCIRDKGIILLNFEMIKAPKYCIEYVILHELIHFIHKNHDAEFFNFLSVLMPDWKERKRVLDEEVVRSL